MLPGSTPFGERRSNRYPFPNLEALKAYFRDWLPDHLIDSRISDANLEFRIRTDTTEEENRLQFVKKCEELLMRALMEAPPSRPGSGTGGSTINSP